ncbi:MAG: amidohydrolase family protein [Planctomycetota bacterium]
MRILFYVLSLSCLALALAYGPSTEAEAEPKKADTSKGLHAYRAARIVTIDGDDVAPGVLVVRDGKVEAVLKADAELPKGAKVVDLGGATILPGLVNPLTAIRESSYRGRSSGQASLSSGSPNDLRKIVALSSVRPEEKVHRRLGRSGYTTYALAPSSTGRLVAGRASVLRPRKGGETKASELALVEKSYMLLGFDLGRTWYSAAVRYLKGAADGVIKARAAKKKAEEDAKKKAAEAAKKKAEGKPADKKPTPKPPTPPSRGRARPPAPAKPAAPPKPKAPDPLMELFEGKIPAFLRVRSPAAMDHLFKFLDSLPLSFKFVLVTGSQSPDVVEKLAKRKDRILGVILEPRLARLSGTTIQVCTARHFIEAGFDVAFVPVFDSLEGFRSIYYYLAAMTQSGLREREALQAVTTVPAKFLGLEGKVGVLKKGAYANFQVFNQDPLSGTARLLKVFIEGQEVFSDDPKTGELSGEAVR